MPGLLTAAAAIVTVTTGLLLVLYNGGLLGSLMPPGFGYEELRAGTGATPGATDRVKVHYRGTLTDGTEFDSSYVRGKSAVFALNGVIKCWTRGLQKMKVGGKSRLTCPPELAYGDQGVPPTVGPGATIVFEIELLEIVG